METNDHKPIQTPKQKTYDSIYTFFLFAISNALIAIFVGVIAAIVFAIMEGWMDYNLTYINSLSEQTIHISIIVAATLNAIVMIWMLIGKSDTHVAVKILAPFIGMAVFAGVIFAMPYVMTWVFGLLSDIVDLILGIIILIVCLKIIPIMLSR